MESNDELVDESLSRGRPPSIIHDLEDLGEF
jgi:hypothetical protein